MKYALIPLLAALSVASACDARSLDEIRSSGTLSVAVYTKFAPFSDEARGIDIDIARALGEKLGVKVSFLPFDADESMDDDLRNMVWKGTVLGYGPADMMMHVPTEAAFANRNDQVTILGAYFRDTLQIARDLARIPELRTIDALANEPVGVEADSLGAAILASPSGGHRVTDLHHYTDMNEAFHDLKAGTLSAVLALGTQAQAAMSKESGYAVDMAPLAGRVPPAGWTFGLAVKADYKGLAEALDQAMTALEQDGTLDAIFASHGVKRLKP